MKRKKSIFVVMVVCIFIFVSSICVFSNPYRLEKLKLFAEFAVSNFIDNK